MELQGITYNTTMGLVVGVIMILVPIFLRTALARTGRTLSGFGYAFVILGLYLGATGLHMALTWPLEQIDGAFCCAVDNVTFGEPAAFYGIIPLIAGLHFGQRRPPAVEPIARMLEGSLLEPLTVFTMYFGTGVAPMLSPFALTNKKVRTIFICITWFIGMTWTFLGLTLFYGHVGFFPFPFNEPVPPPTL
ncbi:DUF981 family protein [Corynebacterium frankenforstense]|uniref:DUF981 family protein n=1 Tax=Corynebacterium frankenforstense TaxID=1230998 RepID=UPI0026ED8C35|nr:DUF981 family protein [Corynebacterium frankenforstense]